MRSSRLLSMALLLQLRGRLTAETLAAELEVSVRTIYRDVDALSAAGVPVLADRGPNGGFTLLDGYRMQLTDMTAQEAATLFLAGVPGAASQLGLADALATAQLKLLTGLPVPWRKDALRIDRCFHLDTVGWHRRGVTPHHLREIASTVWDRAYAEIEYEGSRGRVEQKVAPLGLVLKAGDWYFLGRAVGSDRIYKVENLRLMKRLPDSFDVPEDFDLKASWTREVARYEAELLRGSALVRFAPEAATRLWHLGPAAADAIRAAAPGADGWSEANIPIESIEDAANRLLPLGTLVVVVSPQSLRDRIGEIASSLAAMYGREEAALHS